MERLLKNLIEDFFLQRVNKVYEKWWNYGSGGGGAGQRCDGDTGLLIGFGFGGRIGGTLNGQSTCVDQTGNECDGRIRRRRLL